jgi:antitoxin VapB
MPSAKEASMYQERYVKLFKNGRSQAVRIPREFELPGDNAIMRKDGSRIIIEPVATQSLLALLASSQPIVEDFGLISDPIPDAIDF